MNIFTHKTYLSLSASLLMSVCMYAQLPQAGYYRVQNCNSHKYVSIVDDDVSFINYQANTADFHSILLLKQQDAVVSNPATVIYFESRGTSGSNIGMYDLQSQGTGVAQMLSTSVNVQNLGNGTYYAYGSKSGLSIYLSETNYYWGVNDDFGAVASWDSKNDAKRRWTITPISSTGDNYFGVKPTISLNGKHYATMFADFGFKTASTGMKVYVVSKKASNKAALKEVTGTIPAQTPVIIECSSTNPSDNRLEIIRDNSTKPTNVLKGNFFRITKAEIADDRYENLTAYNAETMRMLGVTSEGKLGLVTANGLDYLPANCAYLEAAGLASELVLMTEEEFDKPDEPQYILGDANGDGKVSITDVTLIIDYIVNANNENYSSSINMDAADFNRDGKVTVTDVTEVVGVIVSNSNN